jgi:hypothetical protein
MITKEYLEELKKLSDSATQGPWNSCVTSDMGNGMNYVEAPRQHGNDFCILKDCNCWHTANATAADYEFVAASREAIPALVAEIERLNEEYANKNYS